MPKGPRGEKRPADVIGAAILVGRIATGEAEDKPSKAPNRAKGGKVGGASRAKSLTAEQRKAFKKTRKHGQRRRAKRDGGINSVESIPEQWVLFHSYSWHDSELAAIRLCSQPN